jgi:Protein of unknown function (DUF3093)
VARLGRSEQVLYEERHWVPWWVLAAAFVAPVVLFLVLALAAGSDSDALSPLAGALVGAAFGLFFAAFFWANHARRVIRVTDRALRIGSREPILLEEIEAAHSLDGHVVRPLRRGLTRREGAEIGIAGIALPALAELALGGSAFAGRHVRAGVIAPPWMPGAAVVLTPGGRTRVWLIGSRHADRLTAALNDARASARDDGRPGEERGERDLE